jgi:hypothetical protein
MTKQIRKNLVHPKIRTGSGSKAVVPAGPAQLGQRQGNHPTNRPSTSYGGVPIYSTGPGFQPAPFGNTKALDVGKGGPGTGRTIYGSGSQCRTGDGGSPLRPQDPLAPWSRK